MAQGVLDMVGAPLVLTAHGSDIETDIDSGHGFRLDVRNDRRARQVMAKARYLTAISSVIERHYEEAGVSREKITRIANGVNLESFQALNVDPLAVRRRHGLPLTGKMILSVGSDRPAKGHRYIPETLARLRARGHDVVWVILGGGPATMAPLAERAGVSDHLFVIPPIGNACPRSGSFPSEDVIAMYRSADLFVMPSLSEGFGMAAIEAMAAGLPVIASEVGGLPSFITHGVNGLLVPPRDVEALQHAVEGILLSPDGGAKLAISAQATAADHDWSKISGEYVELYLRATRGVAK